MSTQQQHREEKVEELQAKAETIKKVHDIVTPIRKVMPEHLGFDLVEQLKKTEEEVGIEAERVVKIMEDFHSKINANKNIEE